MKILDVKAALAAVGLVIRKTDCGEYRVAFRLSDIRTDLAANLSKLDPAAVQEESSYYSDDLSDALATGLDMAARRDAAKGAN